MAATELFVDVTIKRAWWVTPYIMLESFLCLILGINDDDIVDQVVTVALRGIKINVSEVYANNH